MSDCDEKQPSAPPAYDETEGSSRRPSFTQRLWDENIAHLVEEDKLRSRISSLKEDVTKAKKEQESCKHDLIWAVRALWGLSGLLIVLVIAFAVMCTIAYHWRDAKHNRGVHGDCHIGVVELGSCTVYVSGIFLADDLPQHPYDWTYDTHHGLEKRCWESEAQKANDAAAPFSNATNGTLSCWMYLRDIEENRGTPPCLTPKCDNPWEPN